MSIFDLNKIHDSWKPFFTEERVKQIKEIEKQIGENINPIPDKIFRFATTDLIKVKISILGQDPYPSVPKFDAKINQNIDIATGRSFEVGTLTSWTQKFAQHSLKNMIRLIYKTYYEELIEYEDIKEKITEGKFKILPPCELFDNLEKQGVLFLNTYLTCESGKANSHREIWQEFSNDLIKFISETNSEIVWFLWGGEAQKNEKYITKGKIYKSNHPRLYDTDTPEAFLNNTHFEKTKKLVDWRGVEICCKNCDYKEGALNSLHPPCLYCDDFYLFKPIVDKKSIGIKELDSIDLLRKSLPTNLDNAIKELQERIKVLPPKVCYFNSIDDFVAPFTITCDEEMLMQLLLMEKELVNPTSNKSFTIEEFKETLNKEIDSNKEREKKYSKQAEEGFIRHFVYKK